MKQRSNVEFDVMKNSYRSRNWVRPQDFPFCLTITLTSN